MRFFPFNLICRYISTSRQLSGHPCWLQFAPIATTHMNYSVHFIDCVVYSLFAENLRMSGGWLWCLCTLPTNAITGENTLAIISFIIGDSISSEQQNTTDDWDCEVNLKLVVFSAETFLSLDLELNTMTHLMHHCMCCNMCTYKNETMSNRRVFHKMEIRKIRSFRINSAHRCRW